MEALSVRCCRLTACVVALLSGCATVPPQEAGELVLAVETDHYIARVEIDSERGAPLMLAAIEPGTTVHHYLVRPGEYCLRRVVAGDPSVGLIYDLEGWCGAVSAGGKLYLGHVIYGFERGLTTDLDTERLQRQLSDPTTMRRTGRAGVSDP